MWDSHGGRLLRNERRAEDRERVLREGALGLLPGERRAEPLADVDPDWSDRIGLALLVLGAVLLVILLGVGTLACIQYLVENP